MRVNKNKILLGTVFLATLITFFTIKYFQTEKVSDNLNESVGINKSEANDPIEESIQYSLKNIDQQVDECNVETDDVKTHCLQTLLGLVSAEREWKQLKLENLKSPIEINPKHVTVSDQKNITAWRESFLKNRDTQCVAENSFWTGYLHEHSLVSCKIKIEKDAIES